MLSQYAKMRRDRHLNEEKNMTSPSIRTAVRSDIDTVFDRFWSDWNQPFAIEFPALPALDLYERNGTFYAELAVPGYRSDEIEVEANNGIITVSGTHEQKMTEDDVNYHRREIRRGSFVRSMALPQEIDPASVAAKVENGLLTVTASPMKPIANRKIAVAAK